MHTLGWIGLGHMGEPMAKNLLNAGYKVNVYNRSPEKAATLVESGATKLHSPQEIVEQSDIIFIMLSDASAVKAVLTQENGILEAAKPGKIVVDMSTISPEDSYSFANLVAERGGIYIDAPVSGSVGAAKTGQLVILVGGDEKAIETCQPYFKILGKETIHFGSNKKGSSAKLAINLLLGIIGQGIGETILFAEKSGLDKEKVMEMISQSGMNTPLFQGKKEMYRKEEFPSAFMLELMSKDLGLIKAEADRLETELPLAEVANATYRSAKENGKAKLDMAAVYLELKEKNNL
ncbi:NAD(P)-dependent oxidoreductase [Bacillus sp. AFS037270]|uniref:NAD(P)-dependent oxidoreductase n=1 Tax=Bacillus sp. AFS037270 TaxID=2033499 RepID=UPI000BFD301E|nr:NAD(P)-dependent oxidoreductase [Bacillus sp. AFS037270]PGV53454.1 3-hydroxyisobutyrate dehydrogenase [Bacillus sp. AFS037270]